MFPRSLEKTYNQCKEDTEAFLVWLDDKSSACGYVAHATAATSPPRSRTPRRSTRSTISSGRGREGTSRYGVSLRQLNSQIDHIIHSGTIVRLPSRMKVRVQRAIRARQECLAWHESTDHKQYEFDVNGHQFFIRFLREALSRFEELESANIPAASQAARPAPAPASKRDSLYSRNRFSELGLDDDAEA